MDTRWTRFKYSNFLKLFLFIVVVISFTLTLNSFVMFITESDRTSEFFYTGSYEESQEYRSKFHEIIRDLSVLYNYKSEEFIKNGDYVQALDVINISSSHYEDYRYSEKNIDKNSEDTLELYKKDYPDKYKAMEKEVIRLQVTDMKTRLRSLDNVGIKYYMENDGIVISNTKMSKADMLKSYGYLLAEGNGNMEADKIYSLGEANSYISSDFENFFSNNENKLYISYDRDRYISDSQEWSKNKEIGSAYLKNTIILFLITLFSFTLLSSSIGRKAGSQDVHMVFTDYIFTDINILICGIIIFLYAAFLSEVNVTAMDKMAFKLVTAGFASVGLVFVLGLVKHIKNKSLISYSLIYKIFSGIGNFFKEIYRSGSLGKKSIFWLIAYPLLTMVTFFTFPIVAIYLSLKKVKDFEKIVEGVERVKNGELDHTIEIAKKGNLKKLADNINSISEGLNNAVDNELKSERMKTELITNVSHDIRTPLTSIITYIDLLKEEEDPEKRKEYIDILEKKSHRLKSLTDDLFEASKVSSGDIPVSFSKINLNFLLTQGLGELNDKVEENGLDFKINSRKQDIFVKADGDLLWRAIENLLSNIFKYAEKNSRVYVDIYETGDSVFLVMKNISRYELNISSEELMERFKRGDESRTSEGSGLGLSIAESLISIQDGRFNIDIDGDLFKTIIVLNKWK